MTEFDPAAHEADVLDRAIDAVLGREPDPRDADPATVLVVRHLAALHQSPVPDGLRRRSPTSRAPTSLDARSPQHLDPRRPPAHSGRLHRRALVLRGLAAALGMLLVVQGVMALFASRWLADFLGFVYEPHLFREGGILALGVAFAVLLGAWRESWLRTSVAAAVPLSLALGVFGLTEIPHAYNPGAELMHISQAVIAGALGILWLRWRVPTSGEETKT